MNTEDKVRLIFSNPGLSAARLAKMIGVSRQSVNQVRSGVAHRNVLPEFERMPITSGRRCWNCQLAGRAYVKKWAQMLGEKPWCLIDIPESISPYYARECSAFIARNSS